MGKYADIIKRKTFSRKEGKQISYNKITDDGIDRAETKIKKEVSILIWHIWEKIRLILSDKDGSQTKLFAETIEIKRYIMGIIDTLQND